MLNYLDSVILIYYLDHVGPFNVRASNWLAALHAAGDRLAVSDLTKLECRVRPIRLCHAAALARFDGFFAQPDVQQVPLTGAVYDRATYIRAKYNVKTVDAIHLAAAIESGCDRFLTNDNRLAGLPDMVVEWLP